MNNAGNALESTNLSAPGSLIILELDAPFLFPILEVILFICVLSCHSVEFIKKEKEERKGKGVALNRNTLCPT